MRKFVGCAVVTLFALAARGDYLWIGSLGGGDNVSLFNENNWVDTFTGTNPPAGAIDRAVDVWSHLIVTNGSVGGGGASDHLQLGTNRLTQSGGTVRFNTGNEKGIRHDANADGSGGRSEVVVNGGQLIAHFLAEINLTLGGGTVSLTGSNPLNYTTVAMTNFSARLVFSNLPPASLHSSNELAKIKIIGAAAAEGTNVAILALGANGSVVVPMDPGADQDSDGLTDVWEYHFFGNLTQTATEDADGDTLNHLAEFARGTNPTLADTDQDGLSDNAETRTGRWLSPADTGTDPLKPDTDGDGLLDGVETNSGVFVSSANTGTNPLRADTDGDGFRDGVEVFRGSNPGAIAERPPRPNIVLIFVDDLGWGGIGPYGQTNILTPHLDAMAAGGLKLTQFYNGCPVCSPSRTTLMTGKHAGRSWIRANQSLAPSGNIPLPPNTFTLGRMMQQAGYYTGLIGKWGMGSESNVGHPNDHGWDYFCGWLSQGAAHDHYPSGSDRIFRNRTGLPMNGAQYDNDLFNTESDAFLAGRTNGQPFVLFNWTTLPHQDWQAPPAGIDPAYTNKPWSADQKTFATMVSELDRTVGRILQRVQTLGLASNTLVLFASDNGSGSFVSQFNNNGGLRGQKRAVYEGGVRSPLIAWWPGTIAAGTSNTMVAATIDLMATFAELAGAPMPGGIDGISILPTLLGQPQPVQHDHLYWEIFEGNNSDPPPRQAIRKGNWKAVRVNQSSPVELYDLSVDPIEATDRAAVFPNIASEMEALMARNHTPVPYYISDDLDLPLAPHESWFPFNECAGMFSPDLTRFINSQAIVFSQYPTAAPSPWVAGRHGHALQFTGASNSFAQLYLNRGFAGTSARTFAAWVKTTNAGPIAAWGSTNAGAGWTVSVQTNGALGLNVNGGFATGSTNIADGLWHHVAVAWSNDGSPNVTDAKLFIDGVLQTVSASQPATVHTGGASDVLLGKDLAARNWVGAIDELRLYPRALGADEISALYSSTHQVSGAWQQSFFPGVSNFLWGADTDFDGSADFEEYAFGTDPLSGDSQRQPNFSLVAGKWRVTFTRRVADSHDLTYRVEASQDLTNWTQPVLQLAGRTVSSDGCLETVSYETVNGFHQGEATLYLRLLVQFD